MRVLRLAICVLLAGPVSVLSSAEKTEPITLDNVVDPGANRSDEPIANAYSSAQAARFLDAASLAWQKERNCMTCHTNYSYLFARPALGLESPALKTVRQYAERLVEERWDEKGPRWDAEVVMTAAVLAYNDRTTTGTLHPLTRRALERMWTVQRADGGFDWLNCDWPPMESDDYFGAVMAALAAGAAPDDYASSAPAKAGLAKLNGYLAREPAGSLHHRALLLWPAHFLPDLVIAGDRAACLAELLALQRPDGGWALASLGDWNRDDESPQDTQTSDGYGTGFALFIARQAGVPADDARLRRGIAWLKSHQRESGRWYTRSLHRDTRHYITHAGTAFAVLGLAACDALDDGTPNTSTTSGTE